MTGTYVEPLNISLINSKYYISFVYNASPEFFETLCDILYYGHIKIFSRNNLSNIQSTGELNINIHGMKFNSKNLDKYDTENLKSILNQIYNTKDSSLREKILHDSAIQLKSKFRVNEGNQSRIDKSYTKLMNLGYVRASPLNKGKNINTTIQ